MSAEVRAVVVWIVAVPVLAGWAVLLRVRGDAVLLTGAEPFVGHWSFGVGLGTAVAVGMLAAVVRFGPRVAARLSWRGLLLGVWAATTAWATALGASVRWSDLVAPTAGRHEYLPVVPLAAADPLAFWSGFTDQLLAYPIHVKGHPPGLVLLLAGLDRAGLGGPGWATALFVLAGASVVPAVLITVRRLCGTEDVARRAAPALVLAPAALWVATSADAFFAGVLAWGVALLAVASTSPASTPLPDGGAPPPGPAAPPRAGVRLAAAVGAGLLLGACPFLSYGLLHMGALALVVPIVTRRVWPTVVAGLLVVGGLVASGLAGFWLWDGIAATQVAWAAGAGTGRPYLYFLLVDLVVLGALVGPAGVAGLTRLRSLPVPARWIVLVAAGAAVAGALIGFERGEVERIWLPVAYWVAVAAAAVVTGSAAGDRRTRAWLWAQGGTAILLETFLRAPW